VCGVSLHRDQRRISEGVAGVTDPWVSVKPLDDSAFASVRRRAIFECHKWDPQVGDVCTIARHPLVVTRLAWEEVVQLAKALAAETLAAEAELVNRPELHAALGLPGTLRRALRGARRHGAAMGAARIMRFDFHFTSEGWRISEVNCDVPGGMNEASGFPPLMSSHYPWAEAVGDPVAAYVSALARHAGPRGTVAFVHATSYSDDQQMIAFIARRLEAAGLAIHLASPSHLRWHDGWARLEAAWWQGPLDLIVRFFPAEWLDGLPGATDWPQLFAGSRTPLSNPATAILTQSKRLPLIWDRLRTPLTAWRALLPETRDPRDAPWLTADDWVVKPAFGRVGEGIGMRDLIDAKEMRRIARSARWRPTAWVAQRRFHTLPVQIGDARLFPCLGVYTLDEQVVGAYGRLAQRPLIDARAIDAAVLAA
jgi:glutathionylspermidine synthase